MLQLFDSFIQTVAAIVDFLVNSITSLINLFVHIPTYVTFIATSINVLPNLIIPFALCAIAIYVVLFTLGR